MSSDSKSRILIVDDDEKVRSVHARLVGALGHDCETAADGLEALAKLGMDVDLVLLDGQMPHLDGYEVARRIRESPEHAFLPIIMVTGLAGPVEHRRAIEIGINDFVTKPIDPDLLRLRTRWLLELKHAHDELRAQRQLLEHTVEQRTAALRDALGETTEVRRQILRAHLDTIRRLTVAAELKDQETGSHVERIGLYARVLAGALGMSPGEIETVRHAAPLHDVGKLGIPDQVLLKAGKLDESEWEIMRSHTTLGWDLLADSESDVIRMGQVIARSHHERWDGRGYPDGLQGDEIPLEARICAVVDCYDALSMDRPYRLAFPPDVILDMMRAERGARFDPKVLDAFFDQLPAITEIREDHVH